MLNKIIKLLFCTCLFGVGVAVGASVKVFIERGVPVFNGGGELLLLLAIPVSFWLGYLSRKTSHQSPSKTQSKGETPTNESVDIKTATIKIRGTSPLIVHKFSHETIKNNGGK